MTHNQFNILILTFVGVVALLLASYMGWFDSEVRQSESTPVPAQPLSQPQSNDNLFSAQQSKPQTAVAVATEVPTVDADVLFQGVSPQSSIANESAIGMFPVVPTQTPVAVYVYTPPVEASVTNDVVDMSILGSAFDKDAARCITNSWEGKDCLGNPLETSQAVGYHTNTNSDGVVHSYYSVADASGNTAVVHTANFDNVYKSREELLNTPYDESDVYAARRECLNTPWDGTDNCTP